MYLELQFTYQASNYYNIFLLSREFPVYSFVEDSIAFLVHYSHARSQDIHLFVFRGWEGGKRVSLSNYRSINFIFI